ncbi:ATP-binding protein [Oceanibaculum indicum]|uniref:histidine kinase n=1 Tax=Oceanibaculum indicum TaxID=526216 RepID=A0A420WN17_9PROT|nr:ATP-binding protein [Oceanibaculum indicum]RKQ72286.1 signal transduction histidine kinase [Oceanibaculum indicum]
MTRFWERSIWNRSLAGQLVGFMLVALLVSQGISFLIYYDEHGQALRDTLKEEFLVRSASAARLLETTPSAYHADVLKAVDTIYSRFWVTDQLPEDVKAWKQGAWRRLKDREGNGEGTGSEPVVDATAAGPVISNYSWGNLPADQWPLERPARFVRLDNAFGVGLVVELEGGGWLNAAMAKSKKPFWMSQSAVSVGITAILLSLIAVLAARRIGRPMNRLAQAAEAFGRGETPGRLPESGPEDIRRTTEAFNRMQERLRRFVNDRTSMLAAIGHDLRTPITSLRLRAEFIKDAEMRDKILATLDEMQAMTEATLAFAREEASGEETRLVDLAALTESICEDLADLGWDVRFADSSRIPYRCRPSSLRRAIRNLVENAVRYGERARVTMTMRQDYIEIAIDDDGNGIPAGEFERVFAPFVRLEGSRSRETGGVGLGLSVARTIARSHGGDVVLANRDAGGFRAAIHLPHAPAGPKPVTDGQFMAEPISATRALQQF